MGKTGREQRGLLYKELRELGWEPSKQYREYSVGELQGIKDSMTQGSAGFADFTAEGFEDGVVKNGSAPRATSPQPQDIHDRRPELTKQSEPKEAPIPAGLPEGAIRADESGRVWYREEIGPNIAKNRRLRKRITQVVPQTVEVKKIQSGDYIETVEVVGEGTRSLDAFVTLPPTQVGIYSDPRFPFKIFTYNGALGFSYGDVNDYYGGVEFVPTTVKKKFVGNMLAYDIKSVISTVERKYRELMLSRSAPQFAPQMGPRR